jgi:hypothetical protein
MSGIGLVNIAHISHFPAPQVQGDLPSGNLTWARDSRASAPQPGALVVWPHHVGLITAVHRNGLATVISGNDGHRVRERVMSIRRAIGFCGV